MHKALILTSACSPQPRSSSRAGPRGKVGEDLSGELDLEERPEERADDSEESLKCLYLSVYNYEKY